MLKSGEMSIHNTVVADLKVIWDISVDRLVLDSVETPDGGRCVDIFRRGDGTFGFEVYRRDAEDLSGWFPIGGFAVTHYETEAKAREAAARVAPWLSSK